jgi:hypothetical protein
MFRILREAKSSFFLDALVFGWLLLNNAASVQVEFSLCMAALLPQQEC